MMCWFERQAVVGTPHGLHPRHKVGRRLPFPAVVTFVYFVIDIYTSKLIQITYDEAILIRAVCKV